MNKRIVVDSNGRKHITTEPLLHTPQSKQEQDEPVGKFAKFNDGIWREVTVGSSGVLLYTHPKEWVGLTNEQIEKCYETTGHCQTLRPQDSFAVFALARAIEAKLKEKNET